MPVDDETPGSDTSRELVKIPENTRAAQAVKLFGAAEEDVFCNFDPTTEEGGLMLEKCEENPDEKVIEQVNREFSLKYLYSHYIDLVDKKTAAVNTVLRICLVNDKGEVWSCASEGVRRSIRRIMLRKGLGPWDPPIRVRIDLKKIGPDRQWLRLLMPGETVLSESGATSGSGKQPEMPPGNSSGGGRRGTGTKPN